MASEVTQQQRAEAIKFCEHWNTTEIRKLEWLWTQARQEALREAIKLVNHYNCMHNHGKKATKACDDILEQLDRLAREGVMG